ncbi:hypothetical protein Tco_1093611 [Tanacetum coccineum]|uniref:Uncharacterized protein n=1 Tax=Tanacetum coccineum TaxID=301880 RepID=A0ABQ5IFI2_9ASTR
MMHKLSCRSQATTRNKSKEIAKPITPPSESVSEGEDSDPKQAKRDKDMQKNLALIVKYFKNIYKPTNNNLRTSSNTKNKNLDNSLRHKNDKQTRQKLKRAKDYAYHKEKMLLCKQAKKGVTLRSEQGDWLDDTNEEPDEQELEAHYMYMAKIQEVFTVESRHTFDAEPLEQVQTNDDYNVFATVRHHSEQPESINDTYVVKTVDSNVIPNSLDMCVNDDQVDQNAKEYEDERVVLANLITNLNRDHDENKKTLKQLKKANTSLTHELNECKSTLEESNDIRDRYKSALHDEEIELEKYRMYKNCQLEKEEVPYDKDDLANIFAPDSDETLTLAQESRSKLDK